MTNKCLILGAAFVDVIMELSEIPTSGGDATARLKSYQVGGSAFNVHGAISHYLGADAADLMVPIGVGQYGELVRESLHDRHIPVLLTSYQMDNGWDLCLVEPNGERTFITVPGIEQSWADSWFDQINISAYQYFYLSGYEMENVKSANVILNHLNQRAPETHIIFDASPRVKYLDPTIIQRLLQPGVIIHANEDEIGNLIPNQDQEHAASKIFALTSEPVLITLGAKGTYLYDQTGGQLVTSPRVNNVVNTIGAGDTNCGGVIAGLLQGKSIRQACELGNQLAALVIQQDAGSLN